MKGTFERLTQIVVRLSETEATDLVDILNNNQSQIGSWPILFIELRDAIRAAIQTECDDYNSKQRR